MSNYFVPGRGVMRGRALDTRHHAPVGSVNLSGMFDHGSAVADVAKWSSAGVSVTPQELAQCNLGDPVFVRKGTADARGDNVPVLTTCPPSEHDKLVLLGFANDTRTSDPRARLNVQGGSQAVGVNVGGASPALLRGAFHNVGSLIAFDPAPGSTARSGESRTQPVAREVRREEYGSASGVMRQIAADPAPTNLSRVALEDLVRAIGSAVAAGALNAPWGARTGRDVLAGVANVAFDADAVRAFTTALLRGNALADFPPTPYGVRLAAGRQAMASLCSAGLMRQYEKTAGMLIMPSADAQSYAYVLAR